MDGNFFFVIGGVLVLAAVVISFMGIRGSESFPPNRGVLLGVIALFALIVGTTMAFAIVKSVDEQDKRNEELAQEEEQPSNEGEAQPATPGGQPEASEGGNQQPVQPVEPTTGGGGGGAQTGATTLDVSSPSDGSLVFQPDGLEAKPGNLTISYTNPSPVPHSIAVETANGNVLGETQPGASNEQTLDLTDLAPGKYVFFCTVPGHREAGMEGDLTVGG